MKHHLLILWLAVAALANGETNAPPAEPQKPAKTAAAVPPKAKYKPPLRGAPSVRVDGGSRGDGVSLIVLNVLAPDHTGLTTKAQPSLFWYQSKPADVQLELAMIVSDHPQQTVLEVKRPDAKRAGIQRLNLADHKINLEVGVEYEWAVALVANPESRSKDVIASGFIRRVETPTALTARLAGSDPVQHPSIYAEEGVWYDAIEAMGNLLESQPGNQDLKLEEAALLDQVGLTNAAAFLTTQKVSE